MARPTLAALATRERVRAAIVAAPGSKIEALAMALDTMPLATLANTIAGMLTRGEARSVNGRVYPVTPIAVGPSLRRDDRTGTFERRRGGCALLAACEEAWCAGPEGAYQAKCPRVCGHYTEAPPRPVHVGIGSMAGAEMGEGWSS